METEVINKLIDHYKLSEMEHKKILEILKTKIFSNKTHEKRPNFMFVIGQPGCGKTTFINQTNLSNYIIINSDDYRSYSKYSDEILSKYPTHYTKLTNYDSHLWGDELSLYAINNGYSVLREKAPIDFSLIDTIKNELSNSEVIVNVVVTGNLASLLATRERYEVQILKIKNARLSNIEAHNKCYSLLPEFISKCLDNGIEVNFVIQENNKFNIIKARSDYYEVLDTLRNKSNKYACQTYKTRINDIKQKMIKRNAPLEQFREIEEIERIYNKIKL